MAIGDDLTDQGLRSAIISQGRAVYGTQYPTGHTFDVVLDIGHIPSYKVRAHLIVYTVPNSFANWTVVRSSTPDGPDISSILSPMWNLLNQLLMVGVGADREPLTEGMTD